MPIDTEIAGSNSNSYISLEDADLYFADRANSQDWDSLTDDQKTSSLITATNIIDTLEFVDKKYSVAKFGHEDFQRLKVPLSVHLDFEDNVYIPEKFQIAVCEQALFLACHDNLITDTIAQYSLGVESHTDNKFHQTLSSSNKVHTEVKRLLRRWIKQPLTVFRY